MVVEVLVFLVNVVCGSDTTSSSQTGLLNNNNNSQKLQKERDFTYGHADDVEDDAKEAKRVHYVYYYVMEKQET